MWVPGTIVAWYRSVVGNVKRDSAITASREEGSRLTMVDR